MWLSKDLRKRITDIKLLDIKTDLALTPYGISLAVSLVTK